MDPISISACACAFAGAAFLREWQQRRPTRRAWFDRASARAREVGRPLCVVGDPGGGMTHFDYGYGDECVDLTGCPGAAAAGARGHRVNLSTGKISLPSDSHVVFVCYVLECVPDIEHAYRELMRVAGSRENLFVLSLRPSELATYVYPGVRWLIDSAAPNADLSYRPIERRVAVDARCERRSVR